MTATHFTAWLVNDPSALETACMDVSILEDELIGGDPENGNEWASNGDVQFHAVTTVDAVEGDANDAIVEAEALMAAAGWETVGQWSSCDNAILVTVTRA